MSFLDHTPRPRRKPSLTPMIDVVFLLLVFFMLASRFGADEVLPLPLASSQGGSAYAGPPRLVDVGPEGLTLNGRETTAEALAERLGALTERPSDTIILRGRDGAPLQRVVDVASALRAAGFTNLVLVE
ncbi:biopolymer transport protein ExbD [Pseudooceanicola marinus]|uniref:Biopolymer transport protein ExbD n=1 Tax=Pseudooceanicola marinus TaxID=396013 RepID=A0A1X6YCF4_9RHOB|nr:biopolymer transporter ExbD [Pseudooceanicola marinus]PJE33031.1 biopolymer transporter ExbD [Pseudooceanicola marinus]SLN16427.1 biopolymer transport protein ExbD [Pseudooceanicola marinus]